MKLLYAFLFTFCVQNFALKPPISPLYTVDKTKKASNLNSYDTCFLKAPECDPTSKYRTYDGSCNNLEHPTWGMPNTGLVRLFEPRYSDGIELPPAGTDGSELPNARKIITTLFSDKDVPDNVSLIVAQWAQFIAHDFATNVNKEGVDDCCATDDPLVCMPILIPEDDPFFAQYKKTCQALTRTQTTICGDCDANGPKVPINGITQGLDGSQIYGSDEEFAKTLREGKGGRLLVRTLEDGRCFLPSSGSCYKSDVCYVAGESRVNQNTQLTVLHTMLVRAHNVIADGFTLLKPEWDDETNYQVTRSIVIAAYVHITYNEFLPHILSEERMTKAELRSKGSHQYNPEIPNAVIVSFSNPTFRIFHSGLQGIISLYNYHLDITSHINLTDYMNSPGILEEENKFDELILGVITQPMQTLDAFYTSQIEEKLFHFAKPYGIDLNAIDIQRARDHGVPGYPTVLYGCKGIEVKDFDDLADLWPAEKIELVQQLYKSVDDIDLFVGINFENKEEGQRLSPVAQCLVSEQFYRWKYGDRFWYEIQDQPSTFTSEQLEAIKKVTLARLVCIASDHITNVTVNAWAPPGANNPIVSCDDIPALELTPWL